MYLCNNDWWKGIEKEDISWERDRIYVANKRELKVEDSNNVASGNWGREFGVKWEGDSNRREEPRR